MQASQGMHSVGNEASHGDASPRASLNAIFHLFPSLRDPTCPGLGPIRLSRHNVYANVIIRASRFRPSPETCENPWAGDIHSSIPYLSSRDLRSVSPPVETLENLGSARTAARGFSPVPSPVVQTPGTKTSSKKQELSSGGRDKKDSGYEATGRGETRPRHRAGKGSRAAPRDSKDGIGRGAAEEKGDK